MKICFVLPKFTRQPIGGYKIVFEYANRLQVEGNKVAILFINDDALQQLRLPKFIIHLAANYITSVEPKWFPLNVEVKKISNFQRNYLDGINDYDVVFATGIQTVEVVKNNFDNARKFYLIQGYENWGVTEEYLWSTYNAGFTNIVVSNWLKQVVDEHSDTETLLVKNPIDIDIYQRKVSQLDRREHTIGMLYHTEEIKGVKYALEAIYKLREKYPDLLVEMFGMFPEPKNLPEWIHYKRGATQAETIEIYNKVQVFLCASIEEGYGLTGLEAMACGACLVSTAYKGVLEYAEDEYNALLVPIRGVDALIEKTSELFENSQERIRISDNGVESVKTYSWDNTIATLSKIIE